MKGIEKGRKKRNRITLRVRFKEKFSKEKDLYTQGTYHFLQHDHITIKWYIRGLSIFAFNYFSFLRI